jgi:hypothetical protein
MTLLFLFLDLNLSLRGPYFEQRLRVLAYRPEFSLVCGVEMFAACSFSPCCTLALLSEAPVSGAVLANALSSLIDPDGYLGAVLPH